MAKDSGVSDFSFPSILKRVEEEAPPLKKHASMMRMETFDLVKVDEDTKEPPTLVKAILKELDGPQGSVERLAFVVSPGNNNMYAGIYKQKRQLVPDDVLKRIAIQDDLVACIVNARANQVSAHGRARPDRFSTGFELAINVGVLEKLSPEEKADLHRRIEKTVKFISNCGHTDGIKASEKLTFAQFLFMSTKNAVTVGRIATELMSTKNAAGEKVLARFRPIDAGTIFQAANASSSTESVRKEAIIQLARLTGKKLKEEKLPGDVFGDYSWVQVIDGTPRQVFNDEECVVHNFYPVVDVELDGYPVTPIDTMLTAVTTHINITTHNKMYFQTGRASRGMLLIKSDFADENVVARVRQQFNASINSVNNAHRMPVFAVGSQDAIEWAPIDNSSRDAEFQYLTDMNARVILSAFQMAPEELPGWAYLSKGSSNQALAESNNEYMLEAARDLGIRPLLMNFQDFFNASIMPLIDKSLAALVTFKLVGLDAETAEKEAVRFQQDMPIHMTYDQVMEQVEKKPLGAAMGGEFPLNPQFQTVLDKYLMVGVIVEKFFGVVGASKDPNLQYVRDPFWFNYQNILLQKQQAEQAQQAAQQAPQGGGSPPGAPPSGGGGQDAPPAPDSAGGPPAAPQDDQGDQTPGNDNAAPDLTRSIDQAIEVLTKGEDKLPPSKRRLLAQQRQVLHQAMEGWEADLKAATDEIVDVAKKHVKRGR